MRFVSSRPRPRWAAAVCVLCIGFALTACQTSPCEPPPDTTCDPDSRICALRAMWPHAPEHADTVCPDSCASRADIRREAEWVRLHHPRHVPTIVFCAIVAFEAGEPEEAAILLDQALEIQASHPEAAILRSRIALAEGGIPFAEQLLQKQVLLRPDHAGLREALAGVHFAAERWDEAESARLT